MGLVGLVVGKIGEGGNKLDGMGWDGVSLLMMILWWWRVVFVL